MAIDKNDDGMVRLGDVCRNMLGMQCQYGSRYADKRWTEYPFCGEGIRITGNADNYHDMMIHKDDAETFVARVKKARNPF